MCQTPRFWIWRHGERNSFPNKQSNMRWDGKRRCVISENMLFQILEAIAVARLLCTSVVERVPKVIDLPGLWEELGIKKFDHVTFLPSFSSFALEENSLFIIFFSGMNFSDLFKSSSTWEWGPWFVQKIKTIGDQVNLLILKFTSRKRWMTKWHWD